MFGYSKINLYTITVLSVLNLNAMTEQRPVNSGDGIRIISERNQQSWIGSSQENAIKKAESAEKAYEICQKAAKKINQKLSRKNREAILAMDEILGNDQNHIWSILIACSTKMRDIEAVTILKQFSEKNSKKGAKTVQQIISNLLYRKHYVKQFFAEEKVRKMQQTIQELGSKQELETAIRNLSKQIGGINPEAKRQIERKVSEVTKPDDKIATIQMPQRFASIDLFGCLRKCFSLCLKTVQQIDGLIGELKREAEEVLNTAQQCFSSASNGIDTK